MQRAHRTGPRALQVHVTRQATSHWLHAAYCTKRVNRMNSDRQRDKDRERERLVTGRCQLLSTTSCCCCCCCLRAAVAVVVFLAHRTTVTDMSLLSVPLITFLPNHSAPSRISDGGIRRRISVRRKSAGKIYGYSIFSLFLAHIV